MTRITTALRFHALGWRAARGLGMRFDIVLSQSPPLSIGLLSAWIARRHGASRSSSPRIFSPTAL